VAPEEKKSVPPRRRHLSSNKKGKKRKNLLVVEPWRSLSHGDGKENLVSKVKERKGKRRTHLQRKSRGRLKAFFKERKKRNTCRHSQEKLLRRGSDYGVFSREKGPAVTEKGEKRVSDSPLFA